MSGIDPADLLEVHIVEAPVGLWSKAQEHADELVREFMLISEQLRGGEGERPVPVRLTELVEVLSVRYAGLSTAQEAQFAAAVDAGAASIDLVYRVPADVAEAVVHLSDLLDEADAYCEAGEHLLTLATPPDLVRFRRWFLGEFTRQMAGAPPRAWADHPD